MIVLITLLACAAIALRGYIPGATDTGDTRSAPSALAVVLMPVLLTVSVVILLAGVIASQHRLPLAMPQSDRAPDGQRGGLGKLGLMVLGTLAAIALVFAIGTAIFFVGTGQRSEPESVPASGGTSQAPQETTTGAGSPDTSADGLSGSAFVVAAVGAVALVGIALSGLIVVATSGQRKPRPQVPPLAPEPPTPVNSLARAAEMGLAAMNEPGQDPRTAIIACYVAMERGLSFDRAAAPLASDTPMEVLARAFERGALHDASARELVALFEEARFSPHAMLEWQRMRAEQLLRIVLADLQGEAV